MRYIVALFALTLTVPFITAQDAEARRGDRVRHGHGHVGHGHGRAHRRAERRAHRRAARQAYRRGHLPPVYRPHRPYRRPYRDTVYVTCAPEVVNGNVAAVDRIVNEIAATEQFADATKFKAEIAATQTLEPAQKIDAYLNMAGVDPENATEVVEFIGARDMDAKYLSALAQNLELSDEQAHIVASEIQTGIKGTINQ